MKVRQSSRMHGGATRVRCAHRGVLRCEKEGCGGTGSAARHKRSVRAEAPALILRRCKREAHLVQREVRRRRPARRRLRLVRRCVRQRRRSLAAAPFAAPADTHTRSSRKHSAKPVATPAQQLLAQARIIHENAKFASRTGSCCCSRSSSAWNCDAKSMSMAGAVPRRSSAVAAAQMRACALRRKRWLDTADAQMRQGCCSPARARVYMYPSAGGGACGSGIGCFGVRMCWRERPARVACARRQAGSSQPSPALAHAHGARQQRSATQLPS
jgi:hypothetical protein